MKSDNQAAAARVVLGEDDTLLLHTVGIDIGSATSQIVFSDLTLERRGNRYETVDRTVPYSSDILLTPFISDATVDSDTLAVGLMCGALFIGFGGMSGSWAMVSVTASFVNLHASRRLIASPAKIACVAAMYTSLAP